ncbi:DUF5801 repeats-in-toxin domain-containing protein [Croceicoccus naphthovorans]|nr:DUF5801 repeats-in-toxin domain-containing protein [Croceicoccus naphthovorans]MBB3990569.1 VCBS repeat-containing protein [Croceicoccus naphthovorans]
MDFQSNGGNDGQANGNSETFGLAEATPIFNGASNVKRVIADPARENVLVLPEGVGLDDISVEGNNLVIALPDGTTMVVINGAVYVPEIVIDGVTVPPMNIAALLDTDTPEPAAGNQQSSGGDFADPVNPIDPAYDLGDLLPYTELFFPQPENEEIIPYLLNEVPEITFIPDTGDGTIVDEDGLQGNTDERPETPGTMDETDDESTTGTIRYVSPDGTDRLLIDGQDIFEIVDGEVVILEPFVSGYEMTYGTLVINAIDLETGSITYTYTLTDNTVGDGVQDSFDITVIDPQGDSDTGTAFIDIIDDVPFTNDDGVIATVDDNATAVDVGSVDQLLINDEYGADGVGTPAVTIVGLGSNGGTIEIVDGRLIYNSTTNVAPGETDSETFTYIITDSDGSESNPSTFTINLTDEGPTIGDPDGVAATVAVDEEGLGGLAGGPENDLPGEATTQSGTLFGLDFGFDGPGDVVLTGTTYDNLVTPDGNSVVTTWDADTHTLTGTDSVTGAEIFTVELTVDEDGIPTGEYTFTLISNLTHPAGDGENDVNFSIEVVVTDAEGDPATGFINVTVDDDSPVIEVNTDAPVATLVLDESPIGEDSGDDSDGGTPVAPVGRATITADFSGNFTLSNTDPNDPNFGADTPGSVAYTLVLTGEDVASGMFTLDDVSIVLNQDADTGVITGSADGVDYFTISVDADTGVVTFAFTDAYANIAHDNADFDDDTAGITLTEGTLVLNATATDFDGDDSPAASIDLGDNVFQIQDDGPSLTLSTISEDDDGDLVTMTSDADITDVDATLSLSSFFSIGSSDYGTDGAGSTVVTYGLNIIGGGVTTLTSGDAAITLYEGEDGTIIGSTAGDADSITDENTIFTVSVDSETGLITLTQSGPIDHADDSDLAYLGEGVLEGTYNVVVTDADGDTETESSSIDLGDNIAFGDDAPVIEVNTDAPVATLVLDESPIGEDSGDDSDGGTPVAPVGRATITADFSGNFTLSNTDPNDPNFGADTPGSVAYTLVLTGEDVASGMFTLDDVSIVLNQDADTGVITGSADGVDYFTISVDADTGVVTFAFTDAYANIAHDNADFDDDTAGITLTEGTLVLNATATDFDGDDSPAASIDLGDNVFQIQDDGPSLTLSTISEDDDGDLVTMTSDADITDVDATLSLSSFFSIGSSDYGTDGAGSTVVTYGLNIIGGGVTTLTSGDAAITLYEGEDGTIIGSTAGDADSITDENTIFTVSVDSETGLITLTQSGPIDHADDSDLAYLGEGVLEGTYNVVVTDADGDTETESSSIDLGDNIAFGDDAPVITVVAAAGDAILDESPAGTDEGDDQDPGSPYAPDGIASDTFDFSDNFSLSNDDPDADGFGNDVPGSVSYALVLTGENVGSGLYALEFTDSVVDADGYGQGDEIMLAQLADGTIVGYIGSVPTEADADNVWFTITVDGDTGVATFTQLQNVWHASTTSDDDTSVMDITGGTLTLDATATDFDNDDSTSASLDLNGVFQIQDDGPAILGEIDDNVDASIADDQATGNLLNATYVDIGTDSSDSFAGRITAITFTDPDTMAVSNDDLSGGYPLTINTAYGDLVVTEDGQYTFTLDETNPDVVALGTGDVIDLSFGFTLTDADGDPESNVLNITIKGSNQPPYGEVQNAVVSEEGLDNGNEDEVGVPQDDTDSASFSGTFAYDAVTNPGGFQDPDGDNLSFTIGVPTGDYYSADGTLIVWEVGEIDAITGEQVVTGTAGEDGPSVVRVVLDTETGDYDVYLDGPVYHLGEPSETDGIPDGDGNIESEFSITFPVVVSDGVIADNVDTSLIVQIEDDSPVVAAADFDPSPLVVDDSDFGTDATSSFADAFDIEFGGDGEFDTFYTLGVSAQGAASGLTETISGLGINLFLIDGVVYGSTATDVGDVDVGGGSNIAFTISVDTDGDVTLDQSQPVVHDLEGSSALALEEGYADGEAEGLSAADLVTLTATAYDQDGDSASETIDIGDAFFFEDDGPYIEAADPVDAGSLMTSDAEIVDADGTSIDPDVKLNLANVFSYTGADGGNDGTQSIVESYGIALQVDEGTASGLFSGGDPVYLYITDSGVVIGSTSDSEVAIDDPSVVFTINVNSDTGFVGLVQEQPLDHTDGGAFDDVLPLPTGLVEATYTVTITDGDNDTATANQTYDLGGSINFADDVPTELAESVSVSVAEDELPGGNPDDDGINTTATGSFGALVDAGNDLPGTFAFDLSGFVDPGLTSGGDTVLWTVIGDGATLVGYTGDTVPTDVTDAGVVLTVAITDAQSGAFTVTLRDQVDHIPNDPANDDNQTLSIDIASGITYTDYDGDTVSLATVIEGEDTNATAIIVIEDDIPVIFTPDAATLTNADEATFTGKLDLDDNILNNLGADGGSVVFSDTLEGADSGMEAGGQPIIYSLSDDGQTLTGTANGNTLFTITINQDNSEYTVEMFGKVDAFTEVNFTDANYDFIGGNDGWFGIVPNGEISDPIANNSQDVLITPIGGPSVNTSGILGGVDTGQSVGPSEGFRIDYVVDLTGSPPNNYTDGQVNNHTFEGHWTTNGASVSFRQSTGTTLRFSAYDDNGDTGTDGNDIVGDGVQDTITGIVISYNGVQSADLTPTGSLQTVTISGRTFSYQLDGDGGVVIGNIGGANGNSGPPETTVAIFTADGYNSMEVDYVSGQTIKFSGFGAATESQDPVDFSVPLLIVDGDGDTTDTVDLDVTLNPEMVTPLVLDLNGENGAEIVGHEAGFTYDYGDGLMATAWVGEGDGILAHNGEDGINFVFGGEGVTDLEGLAVYDSNGDMLLDSSDAEWLNFGVVLQNGDFVTLADVNVTSISLEGDDTPYYTAGGDAIVFQTSSFTQTIETEVEGETVEVEVERTTADAGFLIAPANDDEVQQPMRQAEAALIAAAAPGLLVAASLHNTPLFDDDGMVNFVPTDIEFATAVNAITPNEVDLSHVSPMAGMDNDAEPEAMATGGSHLSNDGGFEAASFGGGEGPAHHAADLGASAEAVVNFAPTTTPVSGPEVGAEVLAALLDMGAPAATPNGDAEGSDVGVPEAVVAALEEVTGSDPISELVEQVVDTAPESAHHAVAGTDVMEALLNSGVAGHHFQMASPVAVEHADDAAQLAAAAA